MYSRYRGSTSYYYNRLAAKRKSELLRMVNTQKWNGQLPLVVEGEGKDLETDAKQNMVDDDQIYAPFISIPTGRSIINLTSSPQ